jgi:hypothetical protein
MGGEHLGELGIGGTPGKVADVDLGTHALTSKSSFQLHFEARLQRRSGGHQRFCIDP